MESIVQDFGLALRRLRKSPGFTLTALVILGLGIGAVTTMFAVVEAVLLEPLPYPEPDRLHRVFSAEPATGDEEFLSWPDYLDLRAESHPFEVLGALYFSSREVVGADEPVQVRGARVSQEFFELFAPTPHLGRLFDDAENSRGSAAEAGAQVVILKHRFWLEHFGGRDDVLEQTLRLNGKPYTVVGILPPEANFPTWAEVVMPLGDVSDWSRDDRQIRVFGRLAEDVTPASAGAMLDTLGRRIAADHPDSHRDTTLASRSLLDDTVGDQRQSLMVLLGAVGGLLAIVCLNIATLQMVRGLGRRRELAVRAALGAGRGRVLQQLLAESLTLAVAGGALGILLAHWTLDLVVRLVPWTVPRLTSAGVDGPVLAFAIVASLATGVLFGLLPAFRATRFDVQASLKDGRGASGTGWGRRPGVQSGLVVVQVALSLVLLTCAGLLVESFRRLSAVDTGFDEEGLVTAGLVLPPNTYPEEQQLVDFVRQVTADLERLPQVSRASAANHMPLSFHPDALPSVAIDGAAGVDEVDAQELVVAEGYFETLGAVRVAGRAFEEADGLDSLPVAVVNRTFAERAWPGLDPIGRRVQPNPDKEWLTVVGVVADLRQGDLSRPMYPIVYRPYAQMPWNYLNLVARFDPPGPQDRATLQRAVWGVDPNRPMFAVSDLERRRGFHLEVPRFGAIALALFSGFALLLSAIGLYSLLAYAVSQRVREIGIRLALGAQRREVRRMVVAQGMGLALAGAVLGCLGALAATRWLEGMLYGIEPFDPAIFAITGFVLLAGAWAAVRLPAQRASRVEPMAALRDD